MCTVLPEGPFEEREPDLRTRRILVEDRFLARHLGMFGALVSVFLVIALFLLAFVVATGLTALGPPFFLDATKLVGGTVLLSVTLLLIGRLQASWEARRQLKRARKPKPDRQRGDEPRKQERAGKARPRQAPRRVGGCLPGEAGRIHPPLRVSGRRVPESQIPACANSIQLTSAQLSTLRRLSRLPRARRAAKRPTP